MQTQSQPAMLQPSAVGKHQIWSFHILFFAIELVIIFLLGFCFQYPGSATIFPVRNYPALVDTYPGFYQLWPYHQDIIVMAFIGLTFVLVYLKYNGLSAISIGFMTAVLALQLYIIFRGFWRSVFRENWWDAVNLDFSFFISGLYCVIAVMISYTACVGKVGPMQFLYASVFEVFLFTLNEYICFDQVRGFDLGGGMSVYLFGAVWGGILTCFFHRATNINYNLNRNVLAHNTTTIFALIGTLLLWVFWPSLNGGRLAGTLVFGFPFGNQMQRAVLNTVLAMTGSTIATYIVSGLVNVNQFNIEHAMKATLAGGVVIASSSDLCIDPFAAILCGAWAGITTTLLFEYSHPRTKNVDTYGAVYLWVWNGLFGGFLSAMFAGTLFNDKLGTDVSNLFPNGRGVSQQAGVQIAILFISAGIALFGAIFAGLWVLWCPCYRPSDEDLYAQDRVLFWGRPNDLAEKELGPSAVVYVPANVMANPAPVAGMV